MSPDPEERLKAQAECSVRQELYRSKTGKPRQDVGACLFQLDPLLNFSTFKRGSTFVGYGLQGITLFASFADGLN